MTRCPGELDLARALAVGPDERLAAHLDACDACGARWRDQRDAIELARLLPVDVPSERHREEIRTELLARADGPARAAPRRIVHAGVALAAAAAAAIYLAVGGAAMPAHHVHGVVHPRAGARFAAEAAPPDEIVRLHDGTIDAEVEPLGPGERFRIMVGAAEIEVRGTAFTVTAATDRLIAVQVAHGRVEVRAPGEPMAVLAGGEAWHAMETAATVPSVTPTATSMTPPAPAPSRPIPPQTLTPTPPPAPARIRRSPTTPAVDAPSASAAPSATPPTTTPPTPPPRAPDELAYDDAWTQLRAGAFDPAAAAFARVIALAPDGAVADDARYWRAVALARVPRAADAIAAFRDLLDAHAGGAHRGEASAMLGWLLLDARQLGEAERRFRIADDEGDDAVRTSARAGLAALAHRGGAP